MKFLKAKTFVLEVTNGCNWGKCPHCYMNATPVNAQFITMNRVTEFLKYLNSLESKPEQILITGGEPLLHPEIIKIIELVKKEKFITTLVTNGELINKNFIRSTKDSLDKIEVTIRGFQNLHDIMMQPYNSYIWKKIPEKLNLKEKLHWTIARYKKTNHYYKTLKGLQIVHESNKDLEIGLNIDAQIKTDMLDIVHEINSFIGKIDYINIQIQQNSGRARLYSTIPVNLWRHLNAKYINNYLDQAEKLIKDGKVRQINIIDPIRKSVLAEINNELIQKYYKLEVSPSMNYTGVIRANVLLN